MGVERRGQGRFEKISRVKGKRTIGLPGFPLPGPGNPKLNTNVKKKKKSDPDRTRPLALVLPFEFLTSTAENRDIFSTSSAPSVHFEKKRQRYVTRRGSVEWCADASATNATIVLGSFATCSRRIASRATSQQAQRFERAVNIAKRTCLDPQTRSTGRIGDPRVGNAAMKVCMKSTDEVERLQSRLAEAAKEYVADKETTMQPEKVQVIKRVLSQMTVRFEEG